MTQDQPTDDDERSIEERIEALEQEIASLRRGEVDIKPPDPGGESQ